MVEERGRGTQEPPAGMALGWKGIYSSEGERGAEESFIGRRGTEYKGILHKEVLGVIRARSSLHRGREVEQNICGDHRKRLCTQTKARAMLWDARAPKPLTPDLIFSAPIVERTKHSWTLHLKRHKEGSLTDKAALSNLMELQHRSHPASIQRWDNTLVPKCPKPVSATSGEFHHLYW